MKISKNELRKMIFETVLREQEEPTPSGALLDIYRKYDDAKKNKKTTENLVQAMATLLKNKDKKSQFLPGETEKRYQDFITNKVPELKALLEPDDAKDTAAAKKNPAKPPNPKIKQVQNLLNSFLGDSDEQLKVNGYWNPKVMDLAMEKVMSKLNVNEPKRSWVKMAPGLSAAPTLQGLIDFLIKKEKEIGNAQVTVTDDRTEDSTSTSDTSDNETNAEPDASNTIDDTNAARFKEAKALAVKGSVGAEDMRRIHSRIYKIWETGLFNKVKSKPDDKNNDLRNALTKVFNDEKQSNTFLRYFGTAGTTEQAGANAKIRFPAARGPMSKRNKTTAVESLSVLVDDVKRMLEGSEPEYTIGGVDKYVNESKVIYGKSHATLLRERYWGRY